MTWQLREARRAEELTGKPRVVIQARVKPSNMNVLQTRCGRKRQPSPVVSRAGAELFWGGKKSDTDWVYRARSAVYRCSQASDLEELIQLI